MKHLRELNLNSEVWFKLNPRGRSIVEKSESAYLLKIWDEKKDDDGYTREQLWTVMNIFGPHLVMGFDQPIETVIKIDERNLE